MTKKEILLLIEEMRKYNDRLYKQEAWMFVLNFLDIFEHHLKINKQPFPIQVELNAHELAQIMSVMTLGGRYENLTTRLKNKLEKANKFY